MNAICAELGKEQFLYEPEIITEIQQDGKRVSRVVVRVYVDKTNKEIFSQLSCPVFTDIVYQKIKDMYETLFDDDDENNFDPRKVDDSAFGFDMDSNNSIIGHFYIFLATIFNLIDVKTDKTPIIDTKGQIQGRVRYQLSFQIYEQFGNIEV